VFQNCLMIEKIKIKSKQYQSACNYDSTQTGPWTVCHNLGAMAAQCERLNSTSVDGWRQKTSCTGVSIPFPTGAPISPVTVPTGGLTTSKLVLHIDRKPVTCPASFEKTPSGTVCYKIVKPPVTWSEAKTACTAADKASTLVNVLTASDNEAVTTIMKKFFTTSDFSTHGFWTGGSAKDPVKGCSSGFVWGATPATYTNWGQCVTCQCDPPCTDPSKSVVVYSVLQNYTWSLGSPTWKFYPVCQITG